MRNSIVIIIFLGCIFLGLSFFINRDDFEKKENSLDEVVELEKAYQWAYDSEITSQSPIENANLNGYITRAQLAKMMSSFSANILHKVPNTGSNCEFDDVDDNEPFLKLGIVQACQFGLMGQDVRNFRPNDTVTLGEFSVILTRALWGEEFQGGNPYYKKSLKVLSKLGIVEDVSAPLVDQKRGWVLLMLMRSKEILEKGKNEIDNLIYKEYFVSDFVLKDGNTIPSLGLGILGLSDDQAENLVYEALKLGYRLIDTSRNNGNEVGVGRGIKRAIADGIATREEISLSTKVIPSNYSDPGKEVGISLDNLGLDYIDFMLVQQPGGNDKGLYHAFEKAVEEGKVHSIGIANYYTSSEFDRMYGTAKIKPVVIQNENHIFYQNTDLKKSLKKYGIVLESGYPLGGSGNVKEVLSNVTIQKLAEKYEKTPAQIVLRWHVQNGNVAIPFASSVEQLKEYYNIFDFELTKQEMKLIHIINKNQRFENKESFTL